MNRLRLLIKNISYIVFSNLVSFLSAALVTFLAPKVLGVEEYGYFQLYLFYTSYIGCLHFGWADGILLRYGGKSYDSLNKSSFNGQFRLYCCMEGIIAIVLSALTLFFSYDYDKKIVLLCTCAALVLGLPCTFLQYILQATNRMRSYSLPLIIGRAVYVLLASIILGLNKESYLFIIIIDLFGRLLTLLMTGFECKEILRERSAGIASSYIEAKNNIHAGYSLVLASLANTMIIGIVQFFVENHWGIATFGKISLTISVSNILMVFIRAVSLGLFPMLKRIDYDKLLIIYKNLRTILMVVLLGMLMLFTPIKLFLSYWLPQYSDSLKYMALLFPMCIFESKLSMLTETYIKTLRKEKWLLYVNVITIALGVVLSGCSVYILNNLDLTVISILILIAFRGILSELLLTELLNLNIKADIICEVMLTIVFIFSNWFVGDMFSIVIYGLVYAIYLIFKRKSIYKMYNYIGIAFQESTRL